ncbi:MAG: KamA family radical SAM protein [Spirochaetaceae bacterium]|nr:MAG: KamA family radical SAM protein [Spirochaetaceae bacterium]
MERSSSPPDLPRGVSAYYASLAESLDPCVDPIAAQFVPQEAEHLTLPYETPDPIGDELYRVGRRVLHHYRDRILILANDRCATYCRHCFRRHFTGHSTGRITDAEIEEARAYIASHAEVSEALVSGGDPLMMSDDHLFQLFDALRAAKESLIIRLATRVPVVQPGRITAELGARLGRYSPLWTVIHANHPRELTPEFDRAVGHLIDNGVPVLNQAVLLRGINDDPDTLEALLRGLVERRVKPYYLFQGDLAAGTAHFRTSIDTGLTLMKEMRRRLSGLAIPTYAVDLPNGGGKVPLTEATIRRREPGWYILVDDDGVEYRYPHEG